MLSEARKYYLKFIYKKSEKVVERKRKMKILAVEYKGGKCVHCEGVFHPCIYDFHHIDPKQKEGRMAGFLNRTWEKAKLELDKCILLCSNCHRLVHCKDESIK